MAKNSPLGPPKRVQDDSREGALRNLFGLHPSGSRMGSDATDDFGIPFELKSTTKTGVSTARDVGPHTIARWRQHHWIIAKGSSTEFGYLPEEIYYLSPADMEPYFRALEGRFEKDLRLMRRTLKELKAANFSSANIARLEHLIQRGLTLNNPKIPWRFVVEHGTKITENHAETLRQLVHGSSNKAGSKG